MNTKDLNKVNRKIAELRGWQIEAGALDYDLIAPDGRRIDTGYAVEVWTLDQVWENIWSHSGYTRPPQPATDMNAAWDLVIDARHNGWRVLVTEFPKGDAKVRISDGKDPIRVEAASAPLAICIAWLAWKLSEQVESATP